MNLAELNRVNELKRQIARIKQDIDQFRSLASDNSIIVRIGEGYPLSKRSYPRDVHMTSSEIGASIIEVLERHAASQQESRASSARNRGLSEDN